MEYIKTPTISEIDNLEILYRMADELFFECCNIRLNKNLKHIEYIKKAEYLDLYPVVGDYYRNLCKNIISK